jgi:hypothetical protein
MSQALTVAGALSLPLVDGGAVAPITLAATLGYTSRADFVRNYTGTVVNDAVNFGTLASPGAKGVIVLVTSGSCTIAFQATTNEAWPLAPGGYFLWINPSTPLPTSAFITTTGPAAVIFIAVG